jgi:hypothetical protein
MQHTALRLAALLAVTTSVAAAQTNSFVAGSQYTSSGLTGSATVASDMTGMRVEWTFVLGGGGSATWGSLGGGVHGVTGANGFTLRMGSADDTFDTSWELRNSTTARLASLRLRGAAGRTVFDCGWNTTVSPNRCNNTGRGGAGNDGTAGSNDGWSMQTTDGSFAGAVLGEYANLVSVTPNAPVGDLFEQLTLTFVGGMGAGESYFFRADTDSSPTNQPPPTQVVPEPSTYALLATGLAALAALRRRRTA